MTNRAFLVSLVSLFYASSVKHVPYGAVQRRDFLPMGKIFVTNRAAGGPRKLFIAVRVPQHNLWK